MAGFSSHDRIAQAFRPVAEFLRSPEAVDRELRVDRAVDRSGGIKQSAISPRDFLRMGGDANQTSRNTASTSVNTDVFDIIVPLPAGRTRWAFQINADLRATVSDGTNARTEISVFGTVVDSLVRSAPAATPVPFLMFAQLDGANAIDGGQDVNIKVSFRSDTGGTVTVGMQRISWLAVREL